MPRPEIIIDLIRHAESRMNVEMANPNIPPFIGGRQNHVDLSDNGRTQARSLGHYALSNNLKPTRLFCTPAVRSEQTCIISAKTMGLELPITIDDRLQELDQGEWTNQPRSIYDEPANKAAMEELGSDFAAPGGQSMNNVADQMDDFFESLKNIEDRTDTEYIWAHTHGVAIKSWFGRHCDWSHERTYKTPVHNISFSRAILLNGVWLPQYINKRIDIA